MENKLVAIFRTLWLISMGSFLASLVGLQIFKQDLKLFNLLTIIWVASMGVGILTYILYFVFRSRVAENKDKLLRQVVIQGLIGLFVCIIAIPIAAKGVELVERKNNIAAPTLFSVADSKASPESLELRNVKWQNGIFQGELFNKNSRPVFNIQISLKVSKSRGLWDVDEDHTISVPYKIESNQSIQFKENILTAKTNPWWTANVISAKYYQGETIPTPKPTPKSTQSNTVTPRSSSFNGPQLWEAVNKKRVEYGVGPLERDDLFCSIASFRLNELLGLGKLDNHAGFNALWQNPDSQYAWIFKEYSIWEYIIYDPRGDATDAVNTWDNTMGHQTLLRGGQFRWGCTYAQNGFGVAEVGFK